MENESAITSPVPKSGAIQTDTQGAVLESTYMKRETTWYLAQEKELRSLAIFSGVASLFASIAAGIFGFLVNLWMDTAKAMGPEAFLAFSKYMSGFGIVAIVICLVITGVFVALGKTELTTIKRESRKMAARSS